MPTFLGKGIDLGDDIEIFEGDELRHHLREKVAKIKFWKDYIFIGLTIVIGKILDISSFLHIYAFPIEKGLLFVLLKK